MIGRAALAAAWLAAASALSAQQPPASALARADTARADTVRADTARADSAQAVPDSLRVHTLPVLEARPRAGADTEVWVFEREDLLAMQGLSLGDLLDEVPGVVRLRGGDYGAPETATAYGLAGGGIRVFWDGFEQIPLDGAVTDLSRIALGGVERVRVERRGGELRIELESLRDHDPRVLSLVEAGTGDLGTSFFTGTFLHPRALDGSLGLALDRIDTNGPNHENGSATGGWLRYHRFFLGDALALTAEARRMKSGALIPDYPGEATRTDWALRARWQPLPALALQAFTGKSSLEGLARTDRVDVDRTRRQHGLIADVVAGPVRAEGSLRLFGDPGLPSRALDLVASVAREDVGGVEGDVSSESWSGTAATLTRVSAWTRPLLGLSLFASRDAGERGAPILPLSPDTTLADSLQTPPVPGVDLSHRTATRVGARLRWRGADVSVARLGLDTDSLPVLNLPMDRLDPPFPDREPAGLVLPGVSRTGFELSGTVPIPFVPAGFALSGALTQWDRGARYLPKRTWQAYGLFHQTYKQTRDLEVWGRLGVEGRSDMIVPLPSADAILEPNGPAVPAAVPYYRSWHALVQVRVLSVRLFVAWENFTVERDLQDYPGRVLPIFRSHYGVRWTLWN